MLQCTKHMNGTLVIRPSRHIFVKFAIKVGDYICLHNLATFYMIFCYNYYRLSIHFNHKMNNVEFQDFVISHL